jgi:hypothetical protein
MPRIYPRSLYCKIARCIISRQGEQERFPSQKKFTMMMVKQLFPVLGALLFFMPAYGQLMMEEDIMFFIDMWNVTCGNMTEFNATFYNMTGLNCSDIIVEEESWPPSAAPVTPVPTVKGVVRLTNPLPNQQPDPQPDPQSDPHSDPQSDAHSDPP